jgi:tetratricopeptide (TPR) repeat protein
MPAQKRWHLAFSVALAVAGCASTPAWSQAPSASVLTDAVPARSALDGRLFYEVLIGELELQQGEAGNAFETILDAARRVGDEQLFRRAVDIALQARAGDRALQAASAWRVAQSDSLDAIRVQLQVMSALNRVDDMGEPLQALLQLTPEAGRSGLIAAIPRLLQRAPDHKQAAQLVDRVIDAYKDAPATRVAALVASGRAWAAADDADRSLGLAREAHAADAAAPGPILLALDLMAKRPEAEELVRSRMKAETVEPAMRLAYVRVLMGTQRFVDAVAQLDRVALEQPNLPEPFLTLGALNLEMHQPELAEKALLRYVQLVQGPVATSSPVPATSPSADAPAAADVDGPDSATSSQSQGLVQAWLMLAQAAEQRRDYTAAENWLSKIEDPKRALEVQTRRATLLARQGRIADAREAIRQAPEREADDARAKLVAEAGVLREVKRWGDAFEVLEDAAQRFPNDPDVLYEQAMVADKMERMDDMERLLRRVIALKPDNAHAHNALGYSLADRSQRLPEARQLIQRALEISPGDPFITDSLGWVEFRLGNTAQALTLLRQAYASRPDVEIGAHLGEVLWASGQVEEARRIWAESRGRDSANDVLRETLARLKVEL